MLGWVEAWASVVDVKGYLEQKVIEQKGAKVHPGHFVLSLGHQTHQATPGPALRGGLTSGQP